MNRERRTRKSWSYCARKGRLILLLSKKRDRLFYQLDRELTVKESNDGPAPWGAENPHPLSRMKTELVWEGKYDEDGNRRHEILTTKQVVYAA